MLAVGERARAAARAVALSDPERKARAIGAMAAAIDAQHGAILEANARDLTNAEAAGITPAFQDRLRLDATRLEAIAGGLRAIAAQDDPVGAELARWRQPNGLDIARVRTPLGVIGVIYESRPNVTADAGALCLKSGNAVILRGGSDSFYSSRALHACLVAGLTSEGLPADAIQIVPTTDRAAVGDLLSGLNGTVDVIVPRGGRSLVERVQKEARVPVFSHLDGVCHVYVHQGADLEMAREVLLNAKLRRTGICGAAETVLIDKAIAGKAVAELAGALLEAGCEVRGDAASRAIDARIVPASPEDWPAEYLAPIIAMRVVGGMNEAIDHISTYGSAHTESIITGDPQAAEQFLAQVDSAIVMHNASTQFADGGEFGMGAEIGIATGRMHARGPVGAAQLTTFKYVVRGVGQVRPA
ncbi:MAG: glutamate-5-semialdehyde dehydrogenase [Pseudomonadota bacterium]